MGPRGVTPSRGCSCDSVREDNEEDREEGIVSRRSPGADKLWSSRAEGEGWRDHFTFHV